jgi:hypothetical protein
MNFIFRERISHTGKDGTEVGTGTEMRLVGPSKNCLIQWGNTGEVYGRGGGTLDGTCCQEEYHVIGREHTGHFTGQCKGAVTCVQYLL